jgi:hypothetical protein
MAHTKHQQTLQALARLDFTDKGEAFVEQKFITPLLECLGYETHKDYEVIRHGDDGSGFKLKFPPVEQGARQVKTYNPDYVPKIRKKMFWIIEAKSPKDVPYPFAANYMVQGLQYCVHPEIQAKYLMATNGRHTAIHDAHGSIFMDKDLYAPILVFEASELPSKWPEIYELLSVERLRDRIETDLKSMYDKLCLSSLDKSYPGAVLRRIGADAGKHAQAIEKHVMRLYVEGMDRATEQWRQNIEQLAPQQVLELMELPLRLGQSEANYFVPKALAAGMTPQAVFEAITQDFDRQSIFRKEQSVVAATVLYYQTADEGVKERLRDFFDKVRDYALPALNRMECALLRLRRKHLVLSIYPQMRRRIETELKDAPELVRLVRPPTALDGTYEAELALHAHEFAALRRLPEDELARGLPVLLKIEADLEDEFWKARGQLQEQEKQISGFETYGVGGHHYAFKNILVNYGIDPRVEDADVASQPAGG